jgi:hypothetical protein
MEETNGLTGLSIRDFDPIRLAEIVSRACPSEIIEPRSATQGPRKNMLDVERSAL